VAPISNILYSVTASTMTAAAPPENFVPPVEPIGGELFNLIDVARGYDFNPAVGGGGGGHCHEGDADGHIQGGASTHADGDDCEDHDGDGVGVTDAANHHTFQSTRVDSVVFNNVAGTMTMYGAGTDNGNPVTFVALVTSALGSHTSLGSFSLTLSDGYISAGSLIDGSTTLQ
jgi:hypothetical protein